MIAPEVIHACIRGKQSAQKVLYTTFLPYVLTIVRRYGIAKREEADAVQEVFIEVFSSLAKFQATKGSIKTWVRTITVRKVLNLKRAQLRQLIVQELDQVNTYPTAAINYQQHEPAYILRAIAKLPEGYRVVFNLFEVDGYSHPEIAKMLNISEAGSRSQLSRARAALRQALINVVEYGKAG